MDDFDLAIVGCDALRTERQIKEEFMGKVLGKLFSIAFICVWASLAVAAESTVGRWLDDLGSPEYMDAHFTIVKDSGKYFLERRNGDGSGGRYRLEKQKGKEAYVKVGDKFGAVYVVTPNGLEIFDSAGYIRTAKPLN